MLTGKVSTHRDVSCATEQISKEQDPWLIKATLLRLTLQPPAFKKRLNDYPGVIVSSIILRPNGDLIPRTLQENGVKLSPYSWRIKDLRDINQYMSGVISKNR